MQPGNPELPGATPQGDGTNFAIYSAVAERVELCLFDERGRQVRQLDLPERHDGVWHGFLPACETGQRYGYRVHGPWRPGDGLRCNAAKLLVDPYARELAGDFTWDDAVFDFINVHGELRINDTDSAPFVPKSVVREPTAAKRTDKPAIPWSESLVYECNVRGFTMRHPAVAELHRGKFEGMRNGDVIAYLKALGITAVELLPVFAFIDERHLARHGLRNFWGYNSISFFAPMQRYAGTDAVTEFRDMVRSLHDAGLEVILDVAYNHTGEADEHGPTLSLRGIDNRSYYRSVPGDPGRYVNDTGCGNTINVDNIHARRLILDSLAYWARDMEVDGFRFDLATILGRRTDGFSPSHPLLAAISNLPELRNVKLIAEPWDPGPGGYQLGHFPPRWAEWNDRYRDALRGFWRGDTNTSGELARRLHGSADLFEATARPPVASVNLVSAHDGFTLRDVVSYERRHNEANGENNRDGHAHNLSCNYGVEGPTSDKRINELRRRQRLNMLATLLFSQGVPMLLAGDEFGNSQHGNNNAYAQDNETGWLDWAALDDDPDFLEQVRRLVQLRRRHDLLRIPDYVHGTLQRGGEQVTIQWLNRRGEAKQDHEWTGNRAFTVIMTGERDDGTVRSIAIAINGHPDPVRLQLPEPRVGANWRTGFSTDAGLVPGETGQMHMAALSVALLLAG